MIFTLPALFLWGMDPTLLQMTLLAMCGGCLGILFMIPLRRFLIEREHKTLPYPEGTACAEVLMASEVGGDRAKQVFRGIAAGAFFKALTGWARAIPGEAEIHIPFLKKGAIGMDLSAALFGVGYILGPRVGAIMVGGGLLCSLIIIPAIAYWGQSRELPLFPETEHLIRDMEVGLIWTRYVRYIGAGAVATAGIITLIRSIPLMIESFRIGAAQLRGGLGNMSGISVPRTSQDLQPASGRYRGSRDPRRAHARSAGLPVHRGAGDAAGRGAVRDRLRVLLRDGGLAHRRAGRRDQQPHERDDHRRAAGYFADLPGAGLDRHDRQGDRADRGLRGGDRGLDQRRHFAGPQDGISPGRHAATPADGRAHRGAHFRRLRLPRRPAAFARASASAPRSCPRRRPRS